MNKMNEDIHLVMLGDSYLIMVGMSGEPDVHSTIFINSELTFVAEDGAVIRDVFERQIQKIPEDATVPVEMICFNNRWKILSNLKQNFLEIISVIQKKKTP